MFFLVSFKLLVKDKNSILDLATELKNNFSIFSSDILHLTAENNLVSIAFNHFGASIENQKDLILIGRFMAIWEFENDKIIRNGNFGVRLSPSFIYRILKMGWTMYIK